MHTCPRCGQACYCHGDIDDCEVEDAAAAEAACTCDCPDCDEDVDDLFTPEPVAVSQETPCPFCRGGHFRPCQVCGDSGVATFIPDPVNTERTGGASPSGVASGSNEARS
jgi:hypothetical protein